MCKQEYKINLCTDCNFCHEINLPFQKIYFCGILGRALEQDYDRPVLECEISKIIIEGD